LGRRMGLLAAILGVLLLGAGGAGAATATFTDPQGDATGGAADISQVVVSNDFDGNVTFAMTIPNRPTFTADDFVVILLNVDRNTTTGNNGIDYAIVVEATSAVLLQWNGTTFVRVTAPTLTATTNNMTVTVNRSDLGKTTSFNFALGSGLDSSDAAGDSAPDTGGWTYDLALKPTLNTLAAHFSPAKPRAGKPFRVAGTTLRLDDGTTVKADSITCVAKLNGKRLQGRCSWRIPKTARGKRLVVTLTARYKGAKATFTPWRFKVG
jgi:hypothetical protein